MAKTCLQLALDIGETDFLVNIAALAGESVDWLEAGTPWILAQGMAAVRALRAAFPEKVIVADMKIADGGFYEAALGFKAGADLVTVLGSSSDSTIKGALEAAHLLHGRIQVDLLQVKDTLKRAGELTDLGVDYLCVHTAYDDQKMGMNPISELGKFEGARHAPLIVAGGINVEKLPAVLKYQPAVVVIGSAVTGANDPGAMARQMRNVIDAFTE